MTTPFFSFVRPLAVVAFGGNALLRPEDPGDSQTQLLRAREAVRQLLPVLNRGYELIVVHGNGPQVGNLLLQAELAAERVSPQTLDVCVAQTQGSMGFLLELAFDNELKAAGFRKRVVTIVTQVEVDAADPAFRHPSKPIGPFFSRERAEIFRRPRAGRWSRTRAADGARSSRRPKPLALAAASTSVARLVDRGHIVIAGGGGGVPVVVPTRARSAASRR